jgi:hypothetical protein
MRPVKSWQERFWQKVDVRGPDECWPWTAGKLPAGYGLFNLNSKMVLAHRLSLGLKLGRTISPGLYAIHSCDNPICVNPAHLREGTQAENMTDKVERGRQLWGEKHGRAKLTEADVRQIFELRATGLTQLEIAAEVGVDRSQVGCILRGDRWAHLKIEAP